MAAKGYWIGNNNIHDWAGMARYRDANREVMTRYGAKFIMMGGHHEVTGGNPAEVRGNFTVVEFPTYQAAVECYHSPEYQAAAKLRHDAAEGWDVIVAGYDDPQDFTGQAHRT